MIKNKKEAKARVQELIKLINRWNYYYYELNQQLVSDAFYDLHFQELKKIETKFPELKLKNSPTQKVGFQLSKEKEKIKHNRQMLSLDNAFHFEDLKNFDKRVSKITNGEHTYLCEPKIDGLPISIQFKNNHFLVAATRGNGFIGEKITFLNERLSSEIGEIIDQKQSISDFDIQGEAFVTKKNFQYINQEIIKQKKNLIKEKELNLKEELANLFRKRINNLLIYFDNLDEKKINGDYLLIKTNLKNVLKELNPSNKKIILNFYIYYFPKSFFGEMRKKIILNIIEKQTKFSIIEIPENQNKFEIILSNQFLIPINEFVNPRNFASGALRKLDNSLLKDVKLDIIFYQGNFFDNKIQIKTQKDVLQELKKLGYPIANNYRICKNLDEVQNYIEEINSMRKNLSYQIDGVVIKINEHSFYDSLGTNSRFPNYWIAYKFKAEEIETKMLNIFSTVGRTGKITFNAKLEKVFLANTYVQAAILHNANYIEKLDLRIGDYVEIKKSGDIIPKVIRVNLSKRLPNISKWIRPINCAFCHQKLTILENEVDQYCLNNDCEEKKIQALIHFVSRQVMDIVGLDEQNLRAFYKLKLIRNILDIFLLKNKKEHLLKLAKTNVLKRFGVLSINKLLNSIERIKSNSLEKWLFGFNIRHVGEQNALLLAKNFNSIERITKSRKEELIKIEGFGEKLTESVYQFFHQEKNLHLIQKLKNLDINFLYKKPENIQSLFYDKNLVITGNFIFPRNQLIEELKLRGANIFNIVSNKIDYIIVGKIKTSTKLEKAKQLNIKILDEMDLFHYFFYQNKKDAKIYKHIWYLEKKSKKNN